MEDLTLIREFSSAVAYLLKKKGMVKSAYYRRDYENNVMYLDEGKVRVQTHLIPQKFDGENLFQKLPQDPSKEGCLTVFGNYKETVSSDSLYKYSFPEVVICKDDSLQKLNWLQVKEGKVQFSPVESKNVVRLR